MERLYQTHSSEIEKIAAPHTRAIVGWLALLTSASHALMWPNNPIIKIEITAMIVVSMILCLDRLSATVRSSNAPSYLLYGIMAVALSLMAHYGHTERRVVTIALITAGVLTLMITSRLFWTRILGGTVSLSSFLAINTYLGSWTPEMAALTTLVTTAILLLGIVLAITIEQSRRREFKLQSQLNNLLYSTLPSSVVKRIIQSKEDELIVDKVDAATILFLDIVGFTQLTESRPPEALVSLLNEIYSRFDLLVDQTPAEKIKTVGDTYMVVCGIPDPHDNHIEIMANLALDLREAVKRFCIMSGETLQVRIGINTGPVVAGIIGRGRMQYDLWGESVNLASRMESHGVTGKIQVSKAVYEKLEKDFYLSARGTIDIKNSTPLYAYILEGPKVQGMPNPIQENDSPGEVIQLGKAG